MSRKRFALTVLILVALPLAQRGGGWEWQFAAGAWTLAPVTSPAERQAERIVSSEANRLLAPLLSEFTVFALEPKVDLSSRGYFFSAGFWLHVADGRFALGSSASYLDFTLPLTLEDDRMFSYQGIPVASVRTSGQGEIGLRTFMLAAQGRWRAFRQGRFSAYAGLGLTLLRFSGKMHLLLTASVDSILGSTELRDSEDATLAELREENDDIPAWSLSPSFSTSLHYRLGGGSRLFIEFSVSQGTFLAAGLSLGR